MSVSEKPINVVRESKQIICDVYELPNKETVEVILKYIDTQIGYAEQKVKAYAEQRLPLLFGYRRAREEKAKNLASAYAECRTLKDVRDKIKSLALSEYTTLGNVSEVADNFKELTK